MASPHRAASRNLLVDCMTHAQTRIARRPRRLGVGLGALAPVGIGPPITAVVFDLGWRIDAAHDAAINVAGGAAFQLGKLALREAVAGDVRTLRAPARQVRA